MRFSLFFGERASYISRHAGGFAMRAADGAWLSMRQAMARGGVSAHALLKAALLERVRVRVSAGESIRFAREDVERLAAEG